MDTKSLPQSGIIYIFEKADGKRVSIPVEQTPDDITTLPSIKPPVEDKTPVVKAPAPVIPEQKIADNKPPREEVVKKYDPREDLSTIAFTPVPEQPKFDPFGFPAGGFNKPGASPFGKSGASPFGQPGAFPFPGAKPKPFGKPQGFRPFPAPFSKQGQQPFRPQPLKPLKTEPAAKQAQIPAVQPVSPRKPLQKPITVSKMPTKDVAPQTSGATTSVPESQTRPHQAPDAGGADTKQPGSDHEDGVVLPRADISGTRTQNEIKNKSQSDEPNFISADGNPLAGREHDKIRVNPNDTEPVLEIPTPHALNHVSIPDVPDMPKPPAEPAPSPVVLPFSDSNQPLQPATATNQTQPDTRERSASTFNPERPFTPKKSGKGGGGWSGGRLGMALIALSIGGLLAPQIPKLKLEAGFKAKEVKEAVSQAVNPPTPFPEPAAAVFDPLVNPDGSVITPVNTDFALIIPKIGINAKVIANVNPADPADYKSALKDGVAHAVTSFTPDKNGTTYLFSHSTNYEWFIDDLNAIFYLLKELKEGDLIVIVYQNVRYTYKLTNTKVVKPSQISYLSPRKGDKKLILQTCWPPGSVKERLLVFADLVDEQPYQARFEAISPTPTSILE